MKLTQDDFILYLKMHREFEFSYKGRSYFLTPDEQSIGRSRYIIEATDSKEQWVTIFSGTIDELMNYKFDNEYSFNDGICNFEFDYIL